MVSVLPRMSVTSACFSGRVVPFHITIPLLSALGSRYPASMWMSRLSVCVLLRTPIVAWCHSPPAWTQATFAFGKGCVVDYKGSYSWTPCDSIYETTSPSSAASYETVSLGSTQGCQKIIACILTSFIQFLICLKEHGCTIRHCMWENSLREVRKLLNDDSQRLHMWVMLLMKVMPVTLLHV